jgi:hypothetical protein
MHGAAADGVLIVLVPEFAVLVLVAAVGQQGIIREVVFVLGARSCRAPARPVLQKWSHMGRLKHQDNSTISWSSSSLSAGITHEEGPMPDQEASPQPPSSPMA